MLRTWGPLDEILDPPLVSFLLGECKWAVQCQERQWKPAKEKYKCTILQNVPLKGLTEVIVKLTKWLAEEYLWVCGSGIERSDCSTVWNVPQKDKLSPKKLVAQRRMPAPSPYLKVLQKSCSFWEKNTTVMRPWPNPGSAPGLCPWVWFYEFKIVDHHRQHLLWWIWNRTITLLNCMKRTCCMSNNLKIQKCDFQAALVPLILLFRDCSGEMGVPWPYRTRLPVLGIQCQYPSPRGSVYSDGVGDGQLFACTLVWGGGGRSLCSIPLPTYPPEEGNWGRDRTW